MSWLFSDLFFLLVPRHSLERKVIPSPIGGHDVLCSVRPNVVWRNSGTAVQRSLFYWVSLSLWDAMKDEMKVTSTLPFANDAMLNCHKSQTNEHHYLSIQRAVAMAFRFSMPSNERTGGRTNVPWIRCNLMLWLNARNVMACHRRVWCCTAGNLHSCGQWRHERSNLLKLRWLTTLMWGVVRTMEKEREEEETSSDDVALRGNVPTVHWDAAANRPRPY